MDTAVWLSWAVEKIWLFFVGIVVLRSINFVNTPPRVSIPSERGNIEKQHVLDFTFQNSGLDGGTYGDLIRIDAFVRIFAKDFLYSFLHGGHASHTAHQNNFIDVAGRESRILPGLVGRGLRSDQSNLHTVPQAWSESISC